MSDLGLKSFHLKKEIHASIQSNSECLVHGGRWGTEPLCSRNMTPEHDPVRKQTCRRDVQGAGDLGKGIMTALNTCLSRGECDAQRGHPGEDVHGITASVTHEGACANTWKVGALYYFKR